jgi:mono/diheme cytochrome c family protein
MSRFASRVAGRFVLAAVAAVLAHGTALADGSAEKGKVTIVKHGCFQCHGTWGQGSVITSGGKVLTDTQLPFESFKAFVRTTNRAMPPYSEKILSDDDLADIYAYITSLPKFDYKKIPLLNN